MDLKRSWPTFSLVLLAACATPASLPEQVRRPYAARLSELDKIRPGDEFVRHITAQFEAELDCKDSPEEHNVIRIDVLIYEGAQVSSMTLSKQDLVTTTSELTIEPGPEPLVLRLGSHNAHIWRVKGAVSRIRDIYLASNAKGEDGRPLAAVIGVPNANVVLSRDPCLLDDNRFYFLKRLQKAVGWIGDSNSNTIGMIYAYETAGMSLPSGLRYDYDLNRPRRFKGSAASIEAAWSDHLRAYARGVYEITPKDAQRITLARRYNLFPSSLGMIQLLKNGSLIRKANGDYVMIKAIKNPIDIYPDNLIIAKGVPEQGWFTNASVCIFDHKGNQISKTNKCSRSKKLVL